MRRLGLGAVPLGLLLVVAAVALAWWNEGRAVRTERSLAEGERRVVSVTAEGLAGVEPGTLVHVSAPATTATGVVDPVSGLRIDGLRARRSAETLQWRRSLESEESDGPATYRVEWSSTRIESSAWPPEYQNPTTLPVASGLLVADDVRVAGVAVAPDLVARSDGLEALPASPAMARAAAAHSGLVGVVASDGALFLPYGGGSSDAPAVGDVRIRLERVPPGVVSLVGAATGTRLEPAATRAGPPVALFRVGNHSAQELFAGAHQENRTLTGGLRFMAVALTFGGFRLALQPLAALARLVPLLGGLLGVGITSVALVLGASTAATTVAFAWLAFRPLVAVPLLAAAVAGVVWLVRRAGARRAVPATPALLLVALLVGLGSAGAQGGDDVASVDALRAAAAAGGTYRLAATTFELVGALEVDVDLTLVGAGADATLLLLDPDGAGAGVRVAPGVALRLEGLGLTYVGADGGDVLRVDDGRVALVDVAVAAGRSALSDDPQRPFGVGAGLVLRGSAEGRVEGGSFVQNALAAVEVGQDTVIELQGVRFEGNGAGVFADGRATVSITASTFSGHSQNALHVRGEASGTVVATSFTGDGRVETADEPGFDAVRIGEDARVAFEDVVWRDHPRFALSLYGQAAVTSSGGRFEGNGGVYEELGGFYSAILVGESAILELDGDVLDLNLGGAIEAAESGRVVAQDVTIARTGSFASIYVGGSASLRLVGGEVYENEGPIFVTDDGSLTLRGGIVRGNADTGIQASGTSRLSVDGTEVIDHPSYGIVIWEDATGVVREASLMRNRSGIVAFDRSRLRAERNVVVANVRSGIAFLGASRGEAIANQVAEHGLHGIVVAEDADAKVLDNVVEGSTEHGVFFAEQATGEVSGNTIRRNAVGLAIAANATPEVGENVFEENGVDRAEVE